MLRYTDFYIYMVGFLLFLLALVLVIAFALICKRLRMIYTLLFDELYACENHLHYLCERVRNIDNDMYTICQKNGIRTTKGD